MNYSISDDDEARDARIKAYWEWRELAEKLILEIEEMKASPQPRGQKKHGPVVARVKKADHDPA